MSDILETLNSPFNACMHAADCCGEIQSLRAEVTKLRADSEILRTAGIVEVSIRNASVREYMLHWETRTRNAEVEVEKLRADAEWQPIETAPKDGSLFLCWVSAIRYEEADEGRPREVDVSQIDFCNWRTQADIPDCGWPEPCCWQIGDQQDITHWMPLPKPPIAAAREVKP